MYNASHRFGLKRGQRGIAAIEMAITLPVLIAGQNNTRGIQWWFISALTLAAVTPVILIGLFMERYITKGLTAGAVKG